MDGRGRVAQSLTTVAKLGQGLARRLVRARRKRWPGREQPTRDTRFNRLLRRVNAPIRRLPRGTGVAVSAAIILISTTAGVIKGNHVGDVIDGLRDVRDALANTVGFRITSIALTGNHQITREEILATAGVTGRTSLLFLDVDAARDKLKTNPWIADATVLKLYPDRLQIGIKERHAFALWQKAGRVSVIAEDGAVLEPYVAHRFTNLPLLVGDGANIRGNDFLALLARYPAIRDQVRASVLVAERRWNLRLRNGVDVRLPEAAPEHALEQLVALDRDKKLITRDITAIDLRLPDRVTVRLADGPAQARADAFKDKKSKKKGGDA